jgi:hypothetical protein
MQNVQLFGRVIKASIITLILGSPALAVQPSGQVIYEDYVFTDNIKTVQMHAQGREMSYPVIELGGREILVFSFDDLDGDVKNYQYTIVHCNADWTPSLLFPSDYIDGFYENPLSNYRLSFNTFVPYTHYSITLPNNDVSPKLSGNYIIKIFEDYDQEKIVLTRRFMVSESRVSIRARIHRPHLAIHYNTGQQVSFTLHYPDLPVYDPHSEFFVSVMQNGRKDNVIAGLNPRHIRAGETVYENEEKMVFPAGNEFRNFDTKSLRYQTEFIRSIDFRNGLNHVTLHPSRSRQYGRYFSHHDINGRYLIRNEEGRNPSVDADYVLVHFTLPWDVPFDNGNVYVIGALSDWNFYHYNSMAYSYDNKAYELSLLLKQGYYNYQFVFLEDGAPAGDATYFEGNFFETENDYLIKVYHRPPGSRYDRLAGIRQVNSTGPFF